MTEGDSLDAWGRRTWEAQERFLVAYRESGVISRAAEMSGVTTRTVRYWRLRDSLGFCERYQDFRKLRKALWEAELKAAIRWIYG